MYLINWRIVKLFSEEVHCMRNYFVWPVFSMYPSESSPCCLFQSFHVLYYILLPCNIILSHNKILLPSACGSSRSLLTRHDRPQHTRTCVEEPTSPLITHLCTSLPSRIAIAKHALLVALKAGLRLVQVFLNSECHTVVGGSRWRTGGE